MRWTCTIVTSMSTCSGRKSTDAEHLLHERPVGLRRAHNQRIRRVFRDDAHLRCGGAERGPAECLLKRLREPRVAAAATTESEVRPAAGRRHATAAAAPFVARTAATAARGATATASAAPPAPPAPGTPTTPLPNTLAPLFTCCTLGLRPTEQLISTGASVTALACLSRYVNSFSCACWANCCCACCWRRDCAGALNADQRRALRHLEPVHLRNAAQHVERLGLGHRWPMRSVTFVAGRFAKVTFNPPASAIASSTTRSSCS